MTEAKLHRDGIVDAAIALADAEGLDAVSMRRIAARMGVGAMSLYRHVSNKDELLALMTDEVAGRNLYPPAEGRQWTWRDRVRIAADIDRQLYHRHPWVLLTFAVPRYSFGPQSLACLDWLAEGFLELGVSAREATAMSLTVWNYISGATLPEISATLMARKGTNPDGDKGLRALTNATAAPPVLAELQGGDVAELAPEELLYTGLDALCDGFAARAARRPD